MILKILRKKIKINNIKKHNNEYKIADTYAYRVYISTNLYKMWLPAGML